MKKIEVHDTEAQSADIVADNLLQLKALFPEAFSEGKIYFETLRQLLGDAVEESDEKYGLNWHGKRLARQITLSPSTGTLRPCPEESVDWDTTQNLMIEGDNLEVLKLLQKSYAGKVKMIYIDPPYNTGKDFVYPDNFHDNIKNYLELTGQVESGAKLTTNPETSGRYHTDWLNMIYPRLRLAKSLMRPDGVIFISIDDAEMPRLRYVADEIFGEENFLGCFIWKSRQNKDNRTTTGASIDHEYVICYGTAIRGAARNQSQYSNPDNDPRGSWASANMVGIATADRRPNLHYDLINPQTGINYGCPDMGWRYDRNTMSRLISEDRIIWPSEITGRPRRKAFLNELESDFTGFSTLIGQDIYTKHGTEDIDVLFGTRVFNFPKPVRLIASLVEQGSSDGDIVLDFFSGSGTTAHAVMMQNVLDGANRRFISIQLPEPLSPANPEQKTASDFCDILGRPRTIAELTKERLRRSGKKIQNENNLLSCDIGFRVFKLDSSNIRRWNPVPSNLAQSLLDNREHIVEGRTEADIAYELLLKLGLDLCVAIESQVIAGKLVGAVGSGVLILCLAEKVTAEEVELLADGIAVWHKQLAPVGDATVVFRDSAFADDVAKTNMTAILAQNGLEDVRSL